MGEQYFKGVLAGYLGANFMCGHITEWQIDIIKENISHYCEATIDHSLIMTGLCWKMILEVSRR